MARGDTGRWVARAGATGGGRTYRGQMPVKWYSSLVLICVLGVALVVYSRYELEHPAAATPPAIGSHWYQALSFDICGTLQGNLPANPNGATAPVPGIRTDGDGVIQVAPTVASDAGNNATLARFVEHYPGLVVSSTTLRLPGKRTYTSGDACPSGTKDAGQKANVTIKVWPSFTPPGSNNPSLYQNPADIKLASGQLITVAFVPSGAAVPKPSASAITALLNDQSSATSSSTTLPAVTPTTAVSPSTTKPVSTSTTKP
jgi:hypothetical protein